MKSIRIKGREIPLAYTVYEMKTIQEEIAPLSQAVAMVTGRKLDDPEDLSNFGSAEHIGAAAKLIRILGNAGLEMEGHDADLTDKGVMRAMKPADLTEAVTACIETMSAAMASEYPQEEKAAGPVDVVLEEIDKKKGTEG